MAAYENCKALDIITPVMSEVLGGRFSFCADGKFRPTGMIMESVHVDGPWINTRVCTERNCFLWHHIYFRRYGIISRNCFNCWKVVFRPRTLKELFAVYDMQLKDKDKPFCKAGIERREASGHKGLYAAFWYAPLGSSEDEAREFYQKIAVKIRRAFGADCQVILKRGCTEMEDAAGPSESWSFPEEQNVYEDLLDDAWELIKPVAKTEPPALRNVIITRWIGWAVSHGDSTAKEYYDSMASFGVMPTTTYHDKKVDLVSTPMTGKEWRKARGKMAGQSNTK